MAGHFMSMVQDRIEEMAAINFRTIDLRQKFNQFNAQYFNNEVLATTELKWTKSKSLMSGRTVASNTKQDPVARLLSRRNIDVDMPVKVMGGITIEMNTKLLYEEELFDPMFIHEMIHAWFFSRGIDAGHGSSFRAKAEEVGRAFGSPIPLQHEVTGSEAIDGPVKTVGVIVWGPPSRRAFTLFHPNAALEFLNKLYSRSYSAPVEVYSVRTNLGSVYPVLRKYPRLLTGSSLSGSKYVSNLDLSDQNLVVRVEPTNSGMSSIDDWQQRQQHILSLIHRFV